MRCGPLIALVLLAGCAEAPALLPPPGQVAVPGSVDIPIGQRWTVTVETGELVRLVLTDARPRPNQCGAVVTYKHPF